MAERLGDFVVPYQHALETEVGQCHMSLYLAGLLSHLGRKNAEEIATFVHVERQGMQDFIGTASWDHRPLVKVLVGRIFPLPFWRIPLKMKALVCFSCYDVVM